MLKKVLKIVAAEPELSHLDLDAPERTRTHSRIIQKKPFLKKLYLEWYTEILQGLPKGVDGSVLEIGSGGDFFKQVLPDVLTSEILPLPNVDVILDGQRLPFSDGSLQGITMVDVFHHLQRPAVFLHEAARCVRPGGVLIMIEPWRSPWSTFIYRYLHHEDFHPRAEQWSQPEGGPLSQANSALPWIVFERDRKRFDAQHGNWRLRKIRPHTPFRYLLSGGVSMKSLMPGTLFTFWRAMEKLLGPLAKHLAMFATIELVRDASSDHHR